MSTTINIGQKFPPEGIGDWVRQQPDYRDVRASSIEPIHLTTDPVIDLQPETVPVFDQSTAGSCVENAVIEDFRFNDRQEGGDDNLARLGFYWDTRAVEGWQGSDIGSVIRDAYKVASTIGIGEEQTWPYDVSKVLQQPPPAYYESAKAHKILSYVAVDQNPDAMGSCLASGHPFVVGFTLYGNFNSDATGVIQMPVGASVGGHAVLVVGKNDNTQRFKCQNSWGPFWGMGGFFTIPYAYLLNPDLASDFWSSRNVEKGTLPLQPLPVAPVISRVRYKREKKLIISGRWDELVVQIRLDGSVVSPDSEDGEQAVLKPLQLGAGTAHQVTITDKNGESSPYLFVV